MLPHDSLVVDLVFEAGASLDPETMIEALGGKDAAARLKILDPDMQDPRLEMELFPSRPFRRAQERRLLIIDDSIEPKRSDPRTDPHFQVDLRPYKETLISMCEAAPVRLGRLFLFGSWGDAVLVARDARDLRGICLLPWVLDPTVDVDGRKRANRLSQAEFEEKIVAFDKRLEELDEEAILSDLGTATFERRGELLVVDVLESDGTWDLRRSMDLETRLAAIDKFALIPGAPAGDAEAAPAKGSERKTTRLSGVPAEERAPATKPAETKAPEKPAGPPLSSAEIGERVVLVFPPERFDLEVAAALGKKDFDAIFQKGDDVSGPMKDRIYRDGAAWVAPLEFLSEVFVDGVPLSRPAFESAATEVGGGVKTLEVHFPRFGPVLLLDVPDRGRYVSSVTDRPDEVVALLR